MYEKIDQFFALLESFKERQISKLIKKIDTKLYDAIKGTYFNSRISPYFLVRNSEGEPYTHFEEEPDNISQIKKIINALYHARITFEDLEQIDIRSFQNLTQLYEKTLAHAYKASYLLTHLDVDLKEIFAEELAIALPLLKQIQETAVSYGANPRVVFSKLKAYPAGYNTGWGIGVAVNQLHSKNGEFDHNFLAHFSAVLPKYIEKFSQHIRKFASKAMNNAAPLDKKQLDELENAALSLINHLEDLKSNNLFTPLKYMNYIHIVYNIATLFLSSLQQMSNLSENSQDVIRSKLETLKHKLLRPLFSLIDKIETHALIEPGAYSKSLMKQIKSIYSFLVYYASKPVNFTLRGEELTHIEDSRFQAERLEPTYKRIDAANTALFKISKVQESHNRFYKLLTEIQLSAGGSAQPTSNQLTEISQYYKVLLPYLIEIDPDASSILTNSILGRNNSLGEALQYRDRLQALINKNRETQIFQIQINQDMVDSVNRNAELALLPYNSPLNVFQIDESKALTSIASSLNFSECKGNNLLTNPQLLSCEQALELHQWYQNKRAKLLAAQKAYEEFLQLSQGQIQNLSPDVKNQCRNLYNQFQSYFINAVPKNHKEELLQFDRYLVHLLSNKTLKDSVPNINYLVELNSYWQEYVTKTEQGWQNKSLSYREQAEERHREECNAIPLENHCTPSPRAHYVLKHTYYSKGIREFRESLQHVIRQLNESMQKRLIIRSEGLPYPELEQEYSRLAECEQVFAIKAIYNTLYHLELAAVQMEGLNNRSLETAYTTLLLIAYSHVDKIWNLLKKLTTDLHFKIIARDLVSKAQRIWHSIEALVKPYQAQSKEVPTENEVQYNTLWYVVNGFFISPKFFRSLQNNAYISPNELKALNVQAKEATIKIERIVKSSSSYFKLFMQAPVMLGLYMQLKNKLYEFTSTTYDAVLNNIDQLQSEIFLPMVQEADRWEDRLGLRSGILSGPLKQITDEFYKGLLVPLGLDSKAHIAIICDKRPLAARQKAAQSNLVNADDKLKSLDKEYACIETVHRLLTEYEEAERPYCKDLAVVAACKERLAVAYKLALPNLMRLRKKMALQIKYKDSYAELDRFLNSRIKEYDPELQSIGMLIKASYQFLLGLKAAETMKQSTAKEKLSYLSDLAKNQEEEHSLFVKEYTQTAFNRELDATCNRPMGLEHSNEYATRLRAHLKCFAQNMQKRAQKTDNIDLALKNMLQNKAAQFEQEYFAEYYHLNTLCASLAQFKLYLSNATSKLQQKKSFFESEETIREKAAWLNRLNNIAGDENQTVRARIQNIKNLVAGDPNFKRVMYAHKQMEPFSFSHLVHCILCILEALHWYKPKRKALFQDLNKTIDKTPEINILVKRFGLFSASASLVIPEVELDKNPEPDPELRTTSSIGLEAFGT